MAWVWSDGFDCYATFPDAFNGYWDIGNAAGTLVTLVPGRFSGSRAFNIASSTSNNLFGKTSGVNDTVHHFNIAFQQTVAITGSTLGLYLQLLDGTTGQCAVVFRSDGAILLTSGTAAGTVLATYAGAVTTINTWYSFEIEVIINNTTGSFKVRKNGNVVDDHSTTGINTRGGTANNYANKLQISQNTNVNSQQVDDLYWRSDASSLPWFGDMKCMARAPASDASVQFSRTPTTVNVTGSTATTSSKAANAGMMVPFIATYTGTIASGTVQITTGGTGNMKVAIYDATRVTPLATSNAVVNPVSGANAITFSTPLSVTAGTTYYLATDQDTTLVYTTTGNIAANYSFTTTYASFPATSPGATSISFGPGFTLTITLAGNFAVVNEAQQDATTSYVYDSVPGHADLYGIAAIASTPLTTYAVTTRAYAIKSDAGTRTMAVQLKSGASTVASPTVVLTPSNWQWAWRHDTTDPATGAAWTAAAVNVCSIGPTVIA